MLDLYLDNDGKILFNTKITSIISQKNTFQIKFENIPTQEFDYVISSMPIDNFLHLFKNYTKKIPGLKFRNTILVYSNIKSDNIFEDQWLYIQEEKVKAGRITNFNNWVDNIKNNKSGTVLVNEYWANEEDPLWSYSDSELKDICSNDLISCGFLNSDSEIIEYKVVRVPKCYPIYVGDYKSELSKIQSFIDGFDNLQLIGRYGSFKYNNQDHSILMGILAAENITDKANNNIWEINTDYKYHESSTISETGLTEDKNVD